MNHAIALDHRHIVAEKHIYVYLMHSDSLVPIPTGGSQEYQMLSQWGYLYRPMHLLLS